MEAKFIVTWAKNISGINNKPRYDPLQVTEIKPQDFEKFKKVNKNILEDNQLAKLRREFVKNRNVPDQQSLVRKYEYKWDGVMHGIKSILTEFENLEKFYEVESEDKAKFSLLSKTKKAVPTQPIEPFLLFLRQNSQLASAQLGINEENNRKIKILKKIWLSLQWKERVPYVKESRRLFSNQLQRCANYKKHHPEGYLQLYDDKQFEKAHKKSIEQAEREQDRVKMLQILSALRSLGCRDHE